MDILQKLKEEFSLKAEHLENTIKLIDEGNTIPFIARYRKELTGSLDDQILRNLFDRLTYLRNLEARKEQVKLSIQEQDKLTDAISISLENCLTLTEVEDIYRPFKPKRRTRATMAKEKGLEPFANIIWAQNLMANVFDIAKDFINKDLGVMDEDDAIDGAKDIIAEIISDDANIRSIIRAKIIETGLLDVKATNPDTKSVYEMYYDFSEPISKTASHRVLAINRGEKEKFLTVKILVNNNELIKNIDNLVNKQNKYTDVTIYEIVEDSYARLLFPSLERDIRNYLTDMSETSAIKVFSENLRQLLLQPPIKGKNVLALDPGFRTGCKLACVDDTGKVLHVGVVYCTPPQSKIEESKQIIKSLIQKYNIDIIAIGNGTASRETESFVCDLIKELDKKLYYIIVNEAGASVYSASKLASEEFPDFDVSLRSAVSIARRLEDPLAELVKIDPKSIGVGQYQHDMNQKRLGETLGGVVESCVNSVGVDLQTASASLLSYVAGISTSTAKNIVAYRDDNGIFKNRKELLKVKKLGAKTFEQSAGFLRINNGENILDNTGVHPESYDVAIKLITSFGYSLEDVKNGNIQNLYIEKSDFEKVSKNLGIGIPTLKDILDEIKKPGRDARDEMPAPILRTDILSLEDLKEGMILKGTVRNVIDFGLFVDIGVHHDGLVHISEISSGYIKHPLDVVKLGDIIDVKVMSIDSIKKRIALTMKGVQKNS